MPNNRLKQKLKQLDYFNSFCNRMWLDYQDEHLTNPDRLDLKEYKEQYNDWLWKKFNEKEENR